MFTILNVLNYIAGRQLNITCLILLTIGIYSYLMYYCFDFIMDDFVTFATLLLLLIIDIVSLTVIAFYNDSKFDEVKIKKSKSSDSLKNKKNKLKISEIVDDTSPSLKINKKKEIKNIKEPLVKESSVKESSVKESSVKESSIKESSVKKEINKDENKSLENKELISMYDANNNSTIETYK